jgi:hypothetical protein
MTATLQNNKQKCRGSLSSTLGEWRVVTRIKAGDGTRTHDILLGKQVCPLTRHFVEWNRALWLLN